MDTQTERIQLYYKEGTDRKEMGRAKAEIKKENERTNRILIRRLYKLLSAALWHTHSSPASAQKIS